MSEAGLSRTEAVMGTLVTIQAVHAGADAAIERAFGWFYEIEERCTRFNPASELMKLTGQTEHAVSPILFEAVRFAVALAEETGGAFDPTVGRQMEALGFNREYRTGRVLPDVDPPKTGADYRDIELDAGRQTITLRSPLTLDLGSIAKGLSIDMAARELAPYRDFAIDAGGDLYLGGVNPRGDAWTVGIRHPRRDGELIETFKVSNQAVCTSGDYERPRHILDGRSGSPSESSASVTVIGSSAMLADGLATAAFILGPRDGIALLDRMEVEGLIVTSTLERFETRGLRRAA